MQRARFFWAPHNIIIIFIIFFSEKKNIRVNPFSAFLFKISETKCVDTGLSVHGIYTHWNKFLCPCLVHTVSIIINRNQTHLLHTHKKKRQENPSNPFTFSALFPKRENPFLGFFFVYSLPTFKIDLNPPSAMKKERVSVPLPASAAQHQLFLLNDFPIKYIITTQYTVHWNSLDLDNYSWLYSLSLSATYFISHGTHGIQGQ